MEMEIVVPNELPVMTLPGVAFFPQALLPLHIFEPRYRQMLSDVLAKDRLMAVVGLDTSNSAQEAAFEPPHQVATVGIIRACQKRENGTSNLLLQGLCRARITSILSEDPYRIISIQALQSEPGDDPQYHEQLRRELAQLLNKKRQLGAELPEELTEFLHTVKDPDTFVDLAAFSLCENQALKQQLLETLEVTTRFELFNRHLRQEISEMQFRRKLQGELSDDRIAEN
jgi:Lon protease-like protein|uniref:LON peptidase substrate-binding domain-containing protein n=1 Tax=Cephaloticoccus sp. TaxID=1985742 RepID=UPI00404B9224